jgi:hypothetical protein
MRQCGHLKAGRFSVIFCYADIQKPVVYPVRRQRGHNGRRTKGYSKPVGQADADLGGGVYKVRIARPGAGKSGGYRVIVIFRSGERTFYHYAFAKSARDNISQKELKILKNRAKVSFSLTDKQIEERIKNGTLQEIV